MGMSMFDYDLAEWIIREIAEAFSPERIIVFGSVARGEADEHSDLDMLVVMDTDIRGPLRSVPIRMHVLGLGCYMPMDIFVLTPEEYEENKDNRLSFASEIVRTGVVAYEA